MDLVLPTGTRFHKKSVTLIDNTPVTLAKLGAQAVILGVTCITQQNIDGDGYGDVNELASYAIAISGGTVIMTPQLEFDTHPLPAEIVVLYRG